MTSLSTFLWQIATIQKTQRKHFSRSLYLFKSNILDYRAVALEKKGQFRKDFFEIFEIFEHPSQNVSVVQSGSRL